MYSFGVTEFSISGFVVLTISSNAYYVKHCWSSTMNEAGAPSLVLYHDSGYLQNPFTPHLICGTAGCEAGPVDVCEGCQGSGPLPGGSQDCLAGWLRCSSAAMVWLSSFQLFSNLARPSRSSCPVTSSKSTPAAAS